MDRDATEKADDLVLRETLAAERTHLANERTLLAYARSSLTFLVAGVTGVNLLEQSHWKAIAWAFIALGPAIAAFGIFRFVHFRKAVRAHLRNISD